MELTPAGQRRSRQRREARRTILDATEALLVELGLDGFSIRKLAARSGYTAPTIYHHFGDKDGLIDALLEERFARLVGVVERVPAQGDPIEALRGMALAFVRFGLENPQFYRLLMAPAPEGKERVPTPSAERARELLTEPFEHLAAGRSDPELARQTIWALLHGLVSLQIARPEEPWSPRLAEAAIDALIRGLTDSAEPAARPSPPRAEPASATRAPHAERAPSRGARR